MTLELEFVYRLQCPSCISSAAVKVCISQLRMAKLYDLYMLVGDTGYRTLGTVYTSLCHSWETGGDARNTLVHVAAAAISAHATNFSAQVRGSSHIILSDGQIWHMECRQFQEGFQHFGEVSASKPPSSKGVLWRSW